MLYELYMYIIFTRKWDSSCSANWQDSSIKKGLYKSKREWCYMGFFFLSLEKKGVNYRKYWA